MSVFAWGTGTHNAELGTGELEQKLDPTQLEGLRGKVIVSVAACEGTVLAVTEQGELLSWGRNREGQAGHGTDEKWIALPRRIEALASDRIATVAVGPNHCLAANVHGELFAFGRLHTAADNPDEKYFNVAVEMPGMRSHENGQPAMVDRSLTAYYSMDDSGARPKHDNSTNDSYSEENLNFANFKSYLQRSPKLVDGLHNERVVSVAAGYGYSIAITESGHVYSWGYNDKLQLGLGHRFNQHRPQLVRALADEFCVAAACGQQHTLVLTQKGEIYSWGLGVFGQLGHGSLHDEKVPKKITSFSHPLDPSKQIRISAISCGSHHSLALDTDGCVWSWGSSEYAQQFQSEAKYYEDWGGAERGAKKNGQSYYYSIPRLITNAFDGKKVSKIVCGNLHNVAITEDGETWTWGWGVHGALGHGNKRFQLFPMTVNKLKGETIVSVAGAGKSTYAVTSSSNSSYAFDFKQFVDSPVCSDLTIVIGDKTVRAHKAIVFHRCHYLLQSFLFAQRFARRTDDNIVLPSWVDYQSFMALMRYLYTDHVRIPAHFAPKLEALAERMHMPRLAMIAKKIGLQDKDAAWAAVKISPSSFSDDMKESLEDTRFSDIRFVFDDGTQVHSHKLILSSRSEYFTTIFESSFKEKCQSSIPMHEVDRDSFAQLLRYLYTNSVEVTEDNFIQLLLCADRFLAADMKLRIEQMLEEAMQPDNVLDLLLLADRASTPRLRKACINHVVSKIQEMKPQLAALRSSPLLLRELDYLASKQGSVKPGELMRA